MTHGCTSWLHICSQVSTEAAKSMRGGSWNPVWNINFTFDVSDEEELLVEFSVYVATSSANPNPDPAFGDLDEVDLSQFTLYGKISLNLEDLADQKKHSQWLPIQPPARHGSAADKTDAGLGSLLVNVLWLYNLRALI